MLQVSRRALRQALWRCYVARKRFVPPWEKEGRTAEELFAGVMTSANPIQRMRRDSQRDQEREEAVLATDPFTPEDRRRMDERDARNAAVDEARRRFLPYGATPCEYFEETRMAAWGEYASQLKHMASRGETAAGEGGYPAETVKLLLNDLQDTIPYRYTRYVPLPTDGRPCWPLHGTAGLVIDTDGVLHRGGKLIAGADTAIETLKELSIPFVFMTNNGAKSEAETAQDLSTLLGTFVDPTQVLVSHSPMRLLAPRYRQRRVLVAGPPRCADIARAYGFEKAVSLLQFQADHPEMTADKRWDREPVVRPNPKPGSIPFPQVDAIFQFYTPDDPLSDIQTILDVLLSHRGRVGGAVSGVQAVPYYAAADDLLCATAAPLPRLGQGAFREMLSSVYECVTGQSLQAVLFGKPRAIAYHYAAQRLRVVTAGLGWRPADLRAVFMVGDNVETDVLGSNAAQAPWASVHVLSGVGDAPAARRTLASGDLEHEWLETCVPKAPHYIAPTLDHFVRELLAFPEQAVLQNRQPFFGRPNPVDLKEVYCFTP